MKAADLLADLGARGVAVQRRGDALDLEAPPGVLTPQVLDLVREHKAALLQVLGARATAQAQALPGPSYALAEDETPVFLAALKRVRCQLGPRASSRDVHDLAVAVALLDLGRDPP